MYPVLLYRLFDFTHTNSHLLALSTVPRLLYVSAAKLQNAPTMATSHLYSFDDKEIFSTQIPLSETLSPSEKLDKVCKIAGSNPKK